MPCAADPDLRVAVETRLPSRLAPGRVTAVFCFGHCFHRHRAVTGLELIVDGRRHRPTAAGMPRLDLYEWLREERSYRSGFWATLPVAAGEAPGSVELAAAVTLAGGRELVQPLARIEIAEPDISPARPVAAGTVAICMATYDPDPGLLRAQLDSLRGQTDERWVCVISDGGSAPERFQEIVKLVGADERFSVSRSQERLDPYRNFERALELAPPGTELIALCDQDDHWYPDKLAVLRGSLGDAQLVYCDLRMVERDGRVLRDTLWRGRRNEYRNLASLLVANTVPGAAMLLRREVAELALPFPVTPAIQYHDHWLALVALASGEIRYVDRPLYDWVQHPAAVSDGRPGSGASTRWRAAYFGGFMPRAVWAVTLLGRCGPLLNARKRRALSWFAASERSAACFVWLVLRPLRRLAGHGETLGEEAGLARGIAWRWLLAWVARFARRPGALPYDARFPNPPGFEQPRLRRWRSGG